MSVFFNLLQLNNLNIVPFSERHLTERYVAWLNDEEVVRFSEQRHFQHTLQSCTQYFYNIKKIGHYFLALEAHNKELGHIGNIGVTLDRYNQIADMTILIGEKKAWGTGLASIAWNGVLCELLYNQNFRKVTAGTMSVNSSMLRLMERSGMSIESIQRRHFFWQGQEVDLIRFAKFSEV